MPQIAATILTDRATTPVNHTFTPVDISQPGSVGTLIESNGVLANSPVLTVSSRKTTGGKLKGRVTLRVPVVETVAGVDKVTRVGYANFETTFDLSSTLQERKDLVGMMYSALAEAKTVINDAIVKGEAIY